MIVQMRAHPKETKYWVVVANLWVLFWLMGNIDLGTGFKWSATLNKRDKLTACIASWAHWPQLPPRSLFSGDLVHKDIKTLVHLHGCYVRVECSARLELSGCDQDVLLAGDGASALSTLSEHWGYGSMGDTWWRGHGRYPRRTRCSGESAGSLQQILDWHKNSDLGSEVGIGTGLNSTTRRLIESVVLLTK